MLQTYNKNPIYKHKYRKIFINKNRCNVLCYTHLIIFDKRLFIGVISLPQNPHPLLRRLGFHLRWCRIAGYRSRHPVVGFPAAR